MTGLKVQSCRAFYGRLTANSRSESGNYCRSTVLLSDAQAQSATEEPSGEDRVFVMAVRHEVENLIRRGSIFYWRPRIPAASSTAVQAAVFHSAFTVPTIKRRRSSVES